MILTSRYGDDTDNPTHSELAHAITELYHETPVGMTEADYAEHGAAFLRYGFDDGPMIVLEISRLQECRLEEWADQDFEQQLAPHRVMRKLPEVQALQLWDWLARGQIDLIRSQQWGMLQ